MLWKSISMLDLREDFDRKELTVSYLSSTNSI